MSSFDIDLEILYTIKQGFHSFTKIWEKVKGVGSKQTFSKHLSQLIEGNIIYKEKKDGKIYYELGELAPVLESGNDIVNRIKDELSRLDKTSDKTSKKIPPKKLLQNFVTDTKEELAYQSSLRFENLMFQSSRHEEDGNHQSLIIMNEKQIEMIDKLIKLRIKILLEKDDELYETFCHLISYNLEKEYNLKK